MNEENEPILIGESGDLDKDSVENFEHDEMNYAIYNLESGFFATQGHCYCEEQALLSEGTIEGEEIEGEEGTETPDEESKDENDKEKTGDSTEES